MSQVRRAVGSRVVVVVSLLLWVDRDRDRDRVLNCQDFETIWLSLAHHGQVGQADTTDNGIPNASFLPHLIYHTLDSCFLIA